MSPPIPRFPWLPVALLPVALLAGATLLAGCSDGRRSPAEPETPGCRCDGEVPDLGAIHAACGERVCLGGQGFVCAGPGRVDFAPEACRAASDSGVPMPVPTMDGGTPTHPAEPPPAPTPVTDSGVEEERLCDAPLDPYPEELGDRCSVETLGCVHACAELAPADAWECTVDCIDADVVPPYSADAPLDCENCVAYAFALCVRENGCRAEAEAYDCCIEDQCPDGGDGCIEERCAAVRNDFVDCVPLGCFEVSSEPTYAVCFMDECTPGDAESCYAGSAETRGVGSCVDGSRACESHGVFGTCVGAVLPADRDTCANGADEDCDGAVDEGCGPCTPGDTEACYGGPAGTEGVGACRAGARECDETGHLGEACVGEVRPAGSDGTRNFRDDDCDGAVDEDYSCTPSCGGRSCGSDGCGGSCGTCPSGYECSFGACEVIPTCGSNGDSCWYGSDCCSGYCNSSGRCGTNSCSPDGSWCTYSSDCCSGSCSGGTCSSPSSCRTNGSSCSYSSECCSSNCDWSTATCTSGSCRASGDSCSGDSQCCSGVCLGSCV